MNQLRIGTVTCFDHPEASRAQCVKILEEAAEVFEAYDLYEVGEHSEDGLLAECADVIQAVSNLVWSVLNEMYPWQVDSDPCFRFDLDMEKCRQRNVARGRITEEVE